MNEMTKYGGREQTLTANSDSIGEIVARAASEMAKVDNVDKVNLRDIVSIRRVSRNYLNECAAVGCLPTVRGVACRLGVTRQALYDYAKNHRGGAFDEWLMDFSDLCAEATMEAAMSGSVKEVSAIFTAKARYGWRDSLTLEMSPPENPLEPGLTPEAIAAKYQDLPGE